MKKINIYKIYNIKNFILENKILAFMILLVFPILTCIVAISFTALNTKVIILIVLFFFNYIFSLLLFVLLLLRGLQPSRIARSPFYFIKRLHFTNNQSYWDKYQQPLRHLVGAEIGVFKGENAESILNLLNIKELVLVDPWAEYEDKVSGQSVKSSEQEKRFGFVTNKFKNNQKVRIIREYSINVAKMFEDNYFDFVYLDGDHSYEAVMVDLEAWYPKLKQFGVMCGDDYGHPSGVGVIKAVTEFSFKNKLLVGYGEDNQFWFVKV